MDKRAPWRVVIKPGCGEYENTPNSSEILPRFILSSCTSNNENVLQNKCFQERTQKPLGTSKSTPQHWARLHIKKTSYNSHEMLKTLTAPSHFRSVYQLKCQSPSSTSCAAIFFFGLPTWPHSWYEQFEILLRSCSLLNCKNLFHRPWHFLFANCLKIFLQDWG